jgi:TPR repeat protein
MGHAKSINIVGGFFEDGWEVEADIDQAIDHYRRAAEGGDFRGQFNYARLLAERGFVDQALEWLEKIPATATTAFMEKTRDFLLKSELPAFQQKSQWFQARLDRRLGNLQADD